MLQNNRQLDKKSMRCFCCCLFSCTDYKDTESCLINAILGLTNSLLVFRVENNTQIIAHRLNTATAACVSIKNRTRVVVVKS